MGPTEELTLSVDGNMCQHSGPTDQRQDYGLRLAQYEKPVLGRDYVQDTGAARITSNHCPI